MLRLPPLYAVAIRSTLNSGTLGVRNSCLHTRRSSVACDPDPRQSGVIASGVGRRVQVLGLWGGDLGRGSLGGGDRVGVPRPSRPALPVAGGGAIRPAPDAGDAGRGWLPGTSGGGSARHPRGYRGERRGTAGGGRPR